MPFSLYDLTQNEVLIMCCLWEAKNPLTENEILKQCKTISFNKRSIHRAIESMLSKEAIVSVGRIREDKRRAHIYLPLLTRNEYLINRIEHDPAYKSELLAPVVTRLLSGLQSDNLKMLYDVVRQAKEQGNNNSNTELSNFNEE